MRMRVKMGKNCRIEKGVILGYSHLTKIRTDYKHVVPTNEVWIGDNVLIRSGTVIYCGCKIGNNVQIGHNTILREFTEVGDFTKIGGLVNCEGYTKIGHHTAIHAQTHLAGLQKIGDYVFIGVLVVTVNGRHVTFHRPSLEDEVSQAANIEDGAIIGCGACLMSNITIGKGAIVGMGAVVTKDVLPFTVVMGVPAKVTRKVSRMEVATELLKDYEAT